MFLLLAWFLNASVVPAWFLGVVVLALFLALVGWVRQHRSQRAMLRWYEEGQRVHAGATEARRQSHLSALQGLYQTLERAVAVFCGTDEASFQQRLALAGSEYQLPKPLSDARELFIEATTLQKVVLAMHFDLCARRMLDLDLAHYQLLVADLHRRAATFCEERRSLEQMQRLLLRLHELRKTLCAVHSVREGRVPSPPVIIESHQDLYDAVVALGSRLARRVSTPTTGVEAASYEREVQRLEKTHWMLDGTIDLFEQDTALSITTLAHGAWDAVLAYALDSDAAVLLDYYLESQRKSKEEGALAQQILVMEGTCGQRAAFAHFARSMQHWAYWQAMALVLLDARDRDHVSRAYNQFLRDLEWIVPSRLRDLKQAVEAFSLEASAGSHPLFL